MNDLRFYKKIQIEKNIKKGVFIIRHAEKNPVPNRIDVPLTENGKEDALQLGNIFRDNGNNIRFIKTSPFTRCLETCESILRGMNSKLDTQYSNNLGDPGAFVVDDRIAGNNFSYYSAVDVVSRQLKGDILPGLRDIKEGTVRILNEIHDDINANDGIGIYVTHDAIIAPFVGYLTDVPITKENWFGFLDGIFLYLYDGNISLIWNENTYKIK